MKHAHTRFSAVSHRWIQCAGCVSGVRNLFMCCMNLLHFIQSQICRMCMRVRGFQRCRTGGSSVLGASAVYGFSLPASHAFISGVWRPQAVQPYSNHSFVSNACIVHSSEAAKHTVREVDKRALHVVSYCCLLVRMVASRSVSLCIVVHCCI